jgi:hypothetical protein
MILVPLQSAVKLIPLGPSGETRSAAMPGLDPLAYEVVQQI